MTATMRKRVKTARMTAKLPAMPNIDNGAGVSSETAAHAVLRLVAEFPGYMGRTKAVRVLRGLDEPSYELASKPGAFAVAADWQVRDVTALVDAMIDGGLIAATPGARPTLVLTRSGHRALDALEYA